MVFETEERLIDHELIHLNASRACLKIVDPKEVLLVIEVNCIGGAVRIHRVEENLLGGHAISDSVIDVPIERCVVSGHSNTQTNMLCSELVESCAESGCLSGAERCGHLFRVVVQPAVLAS